MLNNEALLLRKGEVELAIVGVDDPYIGADGLSKALDGLGVYRGPVVLLAHSPQVIDEARGVVDLVLAGHMQKRRVVERNIDRAIQQGDQHIEIIQRTYR